MTKFSDCYTEFKVNKGHYAGGAIIRQLGFVSEEECKRVCDEHATCKAVVVSPANWGSSRACYSVNTADLSLNNGWSTAFRKDSCIGTHLTNKQDHLLLNQLVVQVKTY